MNNFSDMLSKAKKMQDQMKEVQENIKKMKSKVLLEEIWLKLF